MHRFRDNDDFLQIRTNFWCYTHQEAMHGVSNDEF